MNPNFREFIESKVQVPEVLTQKTFARCQVFFFDPMRFWLKTFISFLLGMGLSLLLCPQYGLSSLAMTHSLHHLWMGYGDQVCGLLCGSFFVVFASLILMAIMNFSEKKFLKEHSWAFSLILCALSMGSFWMIDSTVIELEFALFWCLGFMIYLKASLVWLGRSYRLQQA